MLCCFAMSVAQKCSWASMQVMKQKEEALVTETLHKRAKLRALRRLLLKVRAREGLPKEFVNSYVEKACSIADREAKIHKREAFIQNIYSVGSIGYIESDHIFSFTAAKRSLEERSVQKLHFFPTYLPLITSRLSSAPIGYIRILYCFSQNYTFRPKVPAPGFTSVGIFSTRSPSRPNQIAMSYAYIPGAINLDGSLPVIGLDALNQSPILSIEFFSKQVYRTTVRLINAHLSEPDSCNDKHSNGKWFSENTFRTQDIRLTIRDEALCKFNQIVSNTPGYRDLKPESFIRGKLCAGTKNSRWLPKRGTIGFGRYRIMYHVDFSVDATNGSPVQNVTVTHIYEF